MVLSIRMGLLALLSATALGKEMEVNQQKAEEIYETGIVHEKLMMAKEVC